jgi:uncharacterized protein YbjT (DUF2867 family)
MHSQLSANGPSMLCLGLGYSAGFACERLAAEGWHITGTTRSSERAAALSAKGWSGLVYDGTAPSAELSTAITSASHLLISAGPDGGGDPLLRHHAADVSAAANLKTIIYLSTVGVYGDHGGAWVDETGECRGRSERARARLAAEDAWRHLARTAGKRIAILRLAGIYGPGRNALENLRAGEARRIVKPGQVFNRIHAEDIAQSIIACCRTEAPLEQLPGGVVNVTDNEPGPPQDVVAFAAGLIGYPVPPDLPFHEANLGAMARSFYADNKRIANARLRDVLGVTLRYPTYRDGLTALAAPLHTEQA